MKAIIQSGSVLSTQPLELKNVNGIVVYDDFDQPIAVVHKVQEGTILVTDVSDSRFHEIVKAIGITINKTAPVYIGKVGG